MSPSASLRYNIDGQLTTETRGGSTIASVAYTQGVTTGVTYPSGAGNAGNGTALAISRDVADRVVGQTWSFASSNTLAESQVLAQSGRVVQDTLTDNGGAGQVSGYSYDTAGRLVNATIPGHTLSYGFGTSSCGTATAGADGNRTTSSDANTVSGVTSSLSYCYDNADRLIGTTQTGTAPTGADPVTAGGLGLANASPSALAYDVHGNTTKLADQSIGYDSTDRHLTTSTPTGTGTATVTYVRDVLGRIVQRTSVVPATSGGSSTLVNDDFTRTVASGWGTATTGGTYSIAAGAPATGTSVSGGQGVLALPAGQTRNMMLSGAIAQDTTDTVTFALDSAPSTGSAYAGLLMRQMAGASDNYTVRAWLNSNGTVWLVVQYGGTSLQSLQLPGITRAAGDAFTLKATVSGTSPTTITAKLWRAGTTEPGSPQLTVTDSTAVMQGAGYSGVHGARGSTATTTGTLSYDNYTVVNTGSTPRSRP